MNVSEDSLCSLFVIRLGTLSISLVKLTFVSLDPTQITISGLTRIKTFGLVYSADRFVHAFPPLISTLGAIHSYTDTQTHALSLLC